MMKKIFKKSPFNFKEVRDHDNTRFILKGKSYDADNPER
jgi:hypothetical protein